MTADARLNFRPQLARVALTDWRHQGIERGCSVHPGNVCRIAGIRHSFSAHLHRWPSAGIGAVLRAEPQYNFVTFSTDFLLRTMERHARQAMLEA